MQDPKFLADVAKARLKVSPTTGAEMDRMMTELKLTPKDVVAVVAKLIGSGGGDSAVPVAQQIACARTDTPKRLQAAATSTSSGAVILSPSI